MSEQPPPGTAEVPADGPAQTLSGEAIESVLDDFRSWLSALRADAPPPPVSEDDGPDLNTLLGQFVALRHEVNLQTKATRGQQEQNAEALSLLRETVENLEQSYAAAQEAQASSSEEHLRPLLKTLIDLHDALALAGREVQRMQDGLLPLLKLLSSAIQPPAVKEEAEPTIASLPPASAWWRRLFGARAAETAQPTDELALLRNELRAERRLRIEETERTRGVAERVGQFVNSMVVGYSMSLQRVERAIRQHGLEPIPTVGQAFDPERMEVVEAVTASGRPGGEVLEEVRRGYLWHERVFRYAQVRVAKG